MTEQFKNIPFISFNDNDDYHQKLKNVAKSTILNKITEVLKTEKPSIGIQLENSFLEEYEIRELLKKEFGIVLQDFETVDLSEYLTYYREFEYNGKVYQYIFTPDCVPVFMETKGQKRLVIIEAMNE